MTNDDLDGVADRAERNGEPLGAGPQDLELPAEPTNPFLHPGKLSRKQRRARKSAVKRHTRRELRRIYRELRMLRHEDGQPMWKPDTFSEVQGEPRPSDAPEGLQAQGPGSDPE